MDQNVDRIERAKAVAGELKALERRAADADARARECETRLAGADARAKETAAEAAEAAEARARRRRLPPPRMSSRRSGRSWRRRGTRCGARRRALGNWRTRRRLSPLGVARASGARELRDGGESPRELAGTRAGARVSAREREQRHTREREQRHKRAARERRDEGDARAEHCARARALRNRREVGDGRVGGSAERGGTRGRRRGAAPPPPRAARAPPRWSARLSARTRV